MLGRMVVWKPGFEKNGIWENPFGWKGGRGIRVGRLSSTVLEVGARGLERVMEAIAEEDRRTESERRLDRVLETVYGYAAAVRRSLERGETVCPTCRGTGDDEESLDGLGDPRVCRSCWGNGRVRLTDLKRIELQRRFGRTFHSHAEPREAFAEGSRCRVGNCLAEAKARGMVNVSGTVWELGMCEDHLSKYDGKNVEFLPEFEEVR